MLHLSTDCLQRNTPYAANEKQAAEERSLNSAPPTKLDFEDRSLDPLIRVRSYAQHLGIFDSDWKYILNETIDPLSPLKKAGRTRFKEMLCLPMEISNKEGTINFEICLDELLEFLSQDPELDIDLIEVFGGMLFYFLGIDNVEKEFNKRVQDEKRGSLRDILEPEEIESLFGKSPDLDLYIALKNANADLLKKKIVTLFASKWTSTMEGAGKEETLFREAFLESKLSDDNTQATVSIGASNSDARQGKLKVDFFCTSKRSDNTLGCRNLRMVIHNGKEITIKKLRESDFTSPPLIPVGKTVDGGAALMSKLAGIADTDNTDELEEPAYTLSFLMTKGFLVPCAKVRKYFTDKIMEDFWKDKYIFRERTNKSCNSHFLGHPFASLCYCLNTYSLLDSCSPSIETFKQLQALYKSHIGLLHNKNCNDTTSMLAQLATTMNIPMPPKVQLALLRLFGTILAGNSLNKEEGAITFTHRHGQLFLDIHSSAGSCQVALYSSSYDALATLYDYINNDPSTNKQKALNVWQELFFAMASSLKAGASPLEVFDERLADFPCDIAAPPAYPFLAQLQLLMLCRQNCLTHSTHLSTLIALFIQGLITEKEAPRRETLFAHFFHCLNNSPLAETLGPNNDALTDLGAFVAADKYLHQIIWECCCHFAAIPLLPFYEAADKLWTRENVTLARRMDNLQLDRLADSFAPHVPRRALQILHSETINHQQTLLLPILKKIFRHFNNGKDLREKLADLPLLTTVTLQYIPLMKGHPQAPLPADLTWLIETMLDRYPIEGFALLEAVHTANLLSCNCLQQQQLEIYLQMCCSLEKSETEQLWPQLTTMFERMANLNEPKEAAALVSWQECIVEAQQALANYFNAMLFSSDLDRWKLLEAFFRKVLTTEKWHKFYANSNSRISLLLTWHNLIKEASLPRPASDDTVLELLLLGCGTVPTKPEAEILVTCTVEALKDHVAANKNIKRPIAILLQKHQEWLIKTLIPHPQLCLDLFDIIGKHNNKQGLTETLYDLLWQALNNYLESHTSSESTTFVAERLAGNSKKDAKCSSAEKALRLKLVARAIAENNISMAVEHLVVLLSAIEQSNDEEAFITSALKCCDHFFATAQWTQAKKLLDHFTAYSKNHSDLRLVTAWQKLSQGFSSGKNWTSATEILVQHTSHFSEHQLQESLGTTAQSCIEYSLKEGGPKESAVNGFKLMQSYKITDVSQWTQLLKLLQKHKDSDTIKLVIEKLWQQHGKKTLTSKSFQESAIYWETYLLAIAKFFPQKALELLDEHQENLTLFDIAAHAKDTACYALILAFLRAVEGDPKGRKLEEKLFQTADALLQSVPQLSDSRKQKIDIAYVKALCGSDSIANFSKACQLLVTLPGTTDKKLLRQLTQKLMTKKNALASPKEAPSLAQDLIALKTHYQKLPPPVELTCFIKPLLAQGTVQCAREAAEIALQLVKKHHSGSSAISEHHKQLVQSCAQFPLSTELAPTMVELLFATQATSFFAPLDLDKKQIALLTFYLDHATAIASRPGLNRSLCIVDSPIHSLVTMLDPYDQEEREETTSLPPLPAQTLDGMQPSTMNVHSDEKWVAQAQSLYLNHFQKLTKYPDLKAKCQDKAIDLSLALMFENNNYRFFTQLFAQRTAHIRDMFNLVLLQQLFNSSFVRLNRLTHQVVYPFQGLILFSFDAEPLQEQPVIDSSKRTQGRERSKRKTKAQKQHQVPFYEQNDLIFQGISQLVTKMLSYQTTHIRNQEYIWKCSHIFMDFICSSFRGKKDEFLHILREFAWINIPNDWGFFKLHGLSINNLFRASFEAQIQNSSLEAAFEIHALLSNKVDNTSIEGTEEIDRRMKINKILNSKISKKTAAQYTVRLITRLIKSSNNYHHQQALVMMKESQKQIAKELGLEVFMSCYRQLFEVVGAEPYKIIQNQCNINFLYNVVIESLHLPEPIGERQHIMGYFQLALDLWRHAPYQYNFHMNKLVYQPLILHIQQKHFCHNSEDLLNFIHQFLDVAYSKISTHQFALQDPSVTNLDDDLPFWREFLYQSALPYNAQSINEVKELLDLVATCHKELDWYPDFARQLVGPFNQWLRNLVGLATKEINDVAYESLMFMMETNLYSYAEETLLEILEFFLEHGFNVPANTESQEQ